MSTGLDDSLTGFGAAFADMACRSHRGHVRSRNEDSCLIDGKRGLMLVADGVGGQGDGLWAGERALELVAEALALQGPVHDGDIGHREEAVAAVLEHANEAMILENADRDQPASGSTIAGLWCPAPGDWATIFNVGDSPVFHLSGGSLQKISRDHSLFQMWIDGGRVGKEPSKRMIVQAMGITERLAPHIVSLPVKRGDCVLLCTDGLVGALDRETLFSLLQSAKSSKSACDCILNAALSGPAVDNLTVSVCCF